MALTPEEVLTQSKNAFKQWEDVWKKQAATNGEKFRKEGNSQQHLLNIGLGKTLLCCAFAPSFERDIDIIAKYQNNVDLACVDKCIGPLLDRGIKPKYVFLADAGIDFDRWCRPWIDQTEDIILIANITVNPEWTLNWKGKVFFYCNKDNIQSEKIFSEISGCKEMIPASSNVGNSVIVFSTQIMQYDQYLLSGYDYCWSDEENYYAFNAGDEPNEGKRFWMNHMSQCDAWGRIVNTSTNLLFSARWLADFLKFMGAHHRVVNCSGGGLLNIAHADLEKKLSNAKVRPLRNEEIEQFIMSRATHTVIKPDQGGEVLKQVLQENLVIDVVVNILPEGAKTWLQERSNLNI